MIVAGPVFQSKQQQHNNTFTCAPVPPLTRKQSFSTASRMSSWCPILETPNFSSSLDVSWSRSMPDKCHVDVGYCWRGESKPARSYAI